MSRNTITILPVIYRHHERLDRIFSLVCKSIVHRNAKPESLSDVSCIILTLLTAILIPTQDTFIASFEHRELWSFTPWFPFQR
jgi:hypothetical protein